MVLTTNNNLVALWPHQEAARAAFRRAVQAGERRGLLVLPTGAGKTILFVTAAQGLGRPALVLVHRDELVQQTIRTACRVWPEARVGVIQGERDEWRDGENLVVASIQSLHSGRLAKMPRDRFGLLVVDEAHHSPATSYQAVMDYFDVLFRLGVTATPKRLDGQGLADWYGPEPLFVYSIRRAIKDGVLVPIEQFAIVTGVSLDAVATRGGDFAEGDLADAVNTPARNEAVVGAFLDRARGRRAIVFAVDLAHVQALVKTFQDAGVKAVSVTGKDNLDTRRQTFADFAAGKFAVLVNCQIATEGFDDQGVDCIVMARPTQSQALYTQCVGRGLRRCDGTGKQDCLTLDVTDNCRRHKLVTATSLLSEERDAEALDGGNGNAAEEQEQQTAAQKIEPLVWRLAEVSPWPELPNLNGYVSSKAWHDDAASVGQLRFLRGFGLDVSQPLTKGEASFLIVRAAKLDVEFPTPPTPAQQRLLRRAGCWQDGLTKREAGRLIGELKRGARCT